jgi:hypothetical protein
MTPCSICETEAPSGRADGYCPDCFDKVQRAMNGELIRRGRAPLLSAPALELARLEEIGARRRPPSIAEQLATVTSPFQVDVILDDFKRFARVSGSQRQRVIEQLSRTAHVRKCQLAGVLP